MHLELHWPFYKVHCRKYLRENPWGVEKATVSLKRKRSKRQEPKNRNKQWAVIIAREWRWMWRSGLWSVLSGIFYLLLSNLKKRGEQLKCQNLWNTIRLLPKKTVKAAHASLQIWPMWLQMKLYVKKLDTTQREMVENDSERFVHPFVIQNNSTIWALCNMLI